MTKEPIRSVFSFFGGVIAPILCLLFDPIVFRGEGFFADIAVVSYVSIAIGIIVLTLWLVSTSRNPIFAHIIGGILLAGAFVALLFGLRLLPFSIIGTLFVGIGLFGFTPFLTACVFGYEGIRAVRTHKNNLSGVIVVTPYIPGLLIAAPLLILLPTKIYETILSFIF